MNTHWEEKGDLGDKGGYNNHGGDRELVSILMLYSDVGRAGDEEDGHPVLVLIRVLKRSMEYDYVGIVEQASSCACEGMLVCPAIMVFLRILG